MEPNAAARWSEKCCLRGLADWGGDGYAYLLDLGVVWPICDTVAEGALASDDALDRRYGLVSTELPVCWEGIKGLVPTELPVCWEEMKGLLPMEFPVRCSLTFTDGLSLGSPADPGGVMGPSCLGAKVERKWEFRPVSSLGSGSIRGSINAWCAWATSVIDFFESLRAACLLGRKEAIETCHATELYGE
jgi:hypothetical protein